MDTIIYKAIYRLDNVYAEGYIILNDGYVEGIFANDYMAIYSKDGNTITVVLKALNIESIAPFSTSYITYDFSLRAKELSPNGSYTFYSNINLDYLELDILEDTVEGEYAIYLVDELLPKLRMITSI